MICDPLFKKHGTRNLCSATQNTEHETWNKKYVFRNVEQGTRNTSSGTQNTEHGIQNTRHGIHVTEHRIWNTEYGTQNKERRKRDTFCVLTYTQRQACISPKYEFEIRPWKRYLISLSRDFIFLFFSSRSFGHLEHPVFCNISNNQR